MRREGMPPSKYNTVAARPHHLPSVSVCCCVETCDGGRFNEVNRGKSISDEKRSFLGVFYRPLLIPSSFSSIISKSALPGFKHSAFPSFTICTCCSVSPMARKKSLIGGSPRYLVATTFPMKRPSPPSEVMISPDSEVKPSNCETMAESTYCWISSMFIDMDRGLNRSSSALCSGCRSNLLARELP